MCRELSEFTEGVREREEEIAHAGNRMDPRWTFSVEPRVLLGGWSVAGGARKVNLCVRAKGVWVNEGEEVAASMEGSVVLGGSGRG